MTSARTLALLFGVLLIPLSSSGQTAVEKAFAYMDAVMDRGAMRLYVYDDADSGLHHFYPTDWMNEREHPKDPMNIVVDSAWSENPCSGSSCMRIHWNGKPGKSGFWNGIVFTTRATWFGRSGPPVDLSEATSLTGWIRSDTPDIQVKVYVGGGRNPFKQVYAKKKERGGTQEWVRLDKTNWTPFEIDLSGIPKDRLAAVQDGFAIVFDAAHASGNKPLNIYLDAVSYNVQRPAVPRFPPSYGARPTGGAFPLAPELFKASEGVSHNVAYQYDMALVVLCYLAKASSEKNPADSIRRARLVADGLLYCAANDRFFDDGALYNGLMAGDARQWSGFPARPGKDLSGRVAGWWDQKPGTEGQWLEDFRHASVSAGDTAWTIIALSALFDKTQDDRYRKAAVRLGQWIRDFCKRPGDITEGFTGGMEGWPAASVKDPDGTGLTPVEKRRKFQTPAGYKSTEMNLDIAVAMYHLARITKDKSWEADCASAYGFVLKKRRLTDDTGLQHFIAGEAADPDNPNAVWTDNKDRNQMPLDTNTWSVLVFGRTPETVEGMRWAEKRCRVEMGAGGFSGFAFSPADTSGVWIEGTGQAIVAYSLLGVQDPAETAKADRYRQELRRIQAASADGGIVAATLDGLFTGFYVHIASENDPKKGTEWRYFSQNHLGGLSWMIYSELDWNPYYQIKATVPPPLLPGMAPREDQKPK